MNIENLEIKIVTFKGLTDVLLKELRELGLKNIKVKNGIVFVHGDLKLLYKLNLSLRTALKILVSIKKFRIEKADDIYKFAKTVKWDSLFSVNKTIKIETVGFSSHYRNLNYASLKVKDAVVDHFRDIYKKRPNIEKKDPDISIHVHVKENMVEISLNSSGVSLHQRGYRVSGHRAPINEVVAASIVLMSKWDKKSDFWDIMCGTGTILIEAAHYALGIPPRKLDRKYSFLNWKRFNEEYLNEIKEELKSKINLNKKLNMYGNDISKKSIKITQSSLEKLNLTDYITLSLGDFKEKTFAKNPTGTIVVNPPYGERLDNYDVEVLYRQIGAHVKENFKGNDFWILSSNLKAIRKIGMKPAEIYELYNGGMEVRFQHYKIMLHRKPRVEK